TRQAVPNTIEPCSRTIRSQSVMSRSPSVIGERRLPPYCRMRQGNITDVRKKAARVARPHEPRGPRSRYYLWSVGGVVIRPSPCPVARPATLVRHGGQPASVSQIGAIDRVRKTVER